jgi:hypothetical protein
MRDVEMIAYYFGLVATIIDTPQLTWDGVPISKKLVFADFLSMSTWGHRLHATDRFRSVCSVLWVEASRERSSNVWKRAEKIADAHPPLRPDASYPACPRSITAIRSPGSARSR